MSENITPPPDPRSARAQGRADRAYRKASRPWPLRHWFLTGIGVIITIVIIAVATSSGGGSSNGGTTNAGSHDETAGKVLQHSEDVRIVSCGRDSLGDVQAKVRITNHSSKASDYVVTVAFEKKPSGDQIDTGDTFVDSLQPGQSTTKEAVSLTSYRKPFKCVLSDAQRTASSF